MAEGICKIQELEKFSLGFKYSILEATQNERVKVLFGVKIFSKNGNSGHLRDFVFKNGDFLSVKFENMEQIFKLMFILGKMCKDFYVRYNELNKERYFSEQMIERLKKVFEAGWRCEEDVK